MSLLTQLRAKQKREEEEKARRRADRIAKKVARTAPADDGLSDLPLAIAVAMEESPAQDAKAESQPVQSDDSVEGLVSRLSAIRERIWRLQSVFAVSLSQETAIEANGWLRLFQDLAQRLKAKDPASLARLTDGHESLLQAPALPIRPTIPLSIQELVEMRWQASTQKPTYQAPKRSTDSIHDGLSWMV
ncbi:MAG: hypothetical protein WB683_05110 [Candidatus Sulfotelmatobacter sp.]